MFEDNPATTPSAEPIPAAPATPAPTAPAPATPPPVTTQTQPAAMPLGLPAFVWNKRTQDILIWSLIASVVLTYIDAAGAYLAARFFVSGILNAVDATGTLSALAGATPVAFDFVNPLTNGLISGVVTAAVFYFLYQRIFTWLQSHSWGKSLNTFFKVVFYPYLIVAAILLVLGSFINLTGALVMLVFTVAGHFVFAFMLDKKIGHHFATTVTPS